MLLNLCYSRFHAFISNRCELDSLEAACLASANGHTALLLSTVPGVLTELQCIRTNQKFHQKFSVFECMKIAQNYAQVSLPLSHTIQYSKMLIFCWKALFH